nr:MAG TPA: helix-turn-helix domain protein [Caudoviricetes sp.]
MIGNRIKQERERQNLSQKELASKTDINVSVMNRIESGERSVRDDEILKISKVLNVTTDYLLGNETPAKFKPQLTDKDKKDIAKQVEDMLDGLDADNPISFQLDGNEIDDDTRELLRQSLQNALEFARLKAKEKFTPKKYRK